MIYFQKPTPNETVFGFLYYALQLVLLPAILLLANELLADPFSELELSFGLFAMNFVAVLLIFPKFLTKNLKAAIAQPWRTLRYAGIGLGMYFIGNVLFSLLITAVAPEYANMNDLSISAMVQENYGLMTVATVLLVPIAEECFYRGLIFRKLYDDHPVLAYILSMVFFSAAHVAGYIGMESAGTLLLSFLQYLPAGFALAWCYRRSGSLFSSVLMHMSVNQLGMLIMR